MAAFAVVLITLLHCAWTHFDKSNGHAPGLAYGPGIDAGFVLCELPCGEHEGLRLPLLLWDGHVQPCCMGSQVSCTSLRMLFDHTI